MSTNFIPGQVLTATQLNNALNGKLDSTGGVISGDVTVNNVVAKTAITASAVNANQLTLSNPVAIASGGTGSNTDTGAFSINTSIRTPKNARYKANLQISSVSKTLGRLVMV